MVKEVTDKNDLWLIFPLGEYTGSRKPKEDYITPQGILYNGKVYGPVKASDLDYLLFPAINKKGIIRMLSIQQIYISLALEQLRQSLNLDEDSFYNGTRHFRFLARITEPPICTICHVTSEIEAESINDLLQLENDIKSALHDDLPSLPHHTMNKWRQGWLEPMFQEVERKLEH